MPLCLDYDEEMEAELFRLTPTPTASSELKLTVRKTKIHEVVNKFKTTLYLKLKSRFSYVNTKPNLLAATLLDPRYKELPFEEYLDSSALRKTCKYIIQDALKEASVDKDTENNDEPPKASVVSSGKKVSKRIYYISEVKVQSLIFQLFF